MFQIKNYYATPDERDALVVDHNFAASWDVRDYDYFKKQCALIRHYEATGNELKVKELLENGIERKYVRIWEGQYVEDTPNNPKPLDVKYKRDVLTTDGMGRIVALFIRKTNQGFTHYMSGNNTAPANVGDSRLYGEKARVGMSTDGYATAAGTVGRYGGTFIPTFPSHVVAESAVVDAPTGGLILNRTVYHPTQRITHTIHEDFYHLSIAIYLSSV